MFEILPPLNVQVLHRLARIAIAAAVGTSLLPLIEYGSLGHLFGLGIYTVLARLLTALVY